MLISQLTQEHLSVIKALEKLDPSRKCFRLVGEVLVERTVKEVLPAVKGNLEQIEMVQDVILLHFYSLLLTIDYVNYPSPELDLS